MLFGGEIIMCKAFESVTNLIEYCVNCDMPLEVTRYKESDCCSVECYVAWEGLDVPSVDPYIDMNYALPTDDISDDDLPF